MKRRDFIKTLPLGLAAATVPFTAPGFRGEAIAANPLLNSLLATDDDRILVLINLNGGNDGLNTIIPFEDPQYDNQRRRIGYVSPAEKTQLAATKLRGDLAFNPMMNFDDPNGRSSKLYKLWQDGKLAVLQNVGYADPNRSHFRATDIWNSASDSNVIVSSGWVGRYLETLEPGYPSDVQPGDDPLAISIGFATTLVMQGNRSVIGAAVNDPSKYNAATYYADDVPPNTNYGDELGYVRNILTQSNIYGGRFDQLFPNGKTPTSNVSYPAANRLAAQLQKVAWCIAAGMKTKVYFVSQGGYDTHIQQNSKDNTLGHGRLLFELAEAISLFQEDVEKFGVADRVIGMTYSEFGRRVGDNSSEGTDHGTCGPQFVFGTQVNGELYGNHPDLVNLDQYQDLKHEFDFREMYAAILSQWFRDYSDGALRKAVLNKPEFTKNPDFNFMFPINGTRALQSIIKSPSTPLSSVYNDRISAQNFILKQNYPNPVVNETIIPFLLSETSRVRLEVFDSRGELISTPVHATLGRGEHPISFNTRNLAAGTYFYRLDVNGNVETKAMKVTR